MKDGGGKLVPLRRAGSAVAAMSDQALLAACGTGDLAALDALFERFHLPLYRFLARLPTTDDLTRDDLVQATFLEVRRSAPHFRGTSSVKTWILGVAANLARQQLRGERRRRAHHASYAEHLTAVPPRPDEQVERRELLARIERALGGLPHDQQVAFVLCDLEQVPGVEVARALGVPEGTLWRRLHDARKAVRAAVEGDRLMREPACHRELDVSRALYTGPDASLASHLAGCGACQQTWRALESTLALARELAAPLPSPARREEVRAAVLAAAESGQAGRIDPWLPSLRFFRLTPPRRAPRGRWLALVAAVALVAVGIARGHRRDIHPQSHAAVHARAGAVFTMISAPPDETWRLRDGTVELEIEPLGPGQRFRVMAGDGEVEVRGTAFTVAAIGDHLAGVSVAHGRVEIRPRAGTGAPLTLGPGQAWHADRSVPPLVGAAPPAPTPVPSAPAPLSATSPPPTTARRPERPRERSIALSQTDHIRPPAPTMQESLYDDAWDAMRAGDFAKAAARFAGVVGTSANGPLADEGAFWRAVATARAGHAATAIELFRDMLDVYPASPRRGEAAAMLGWLLLEAGHPDQAQPLFRAAARDPSERVRASARHGLEAGR